jgi:exonuclease VII small subunit
MDLGAVLQPAVLTLQNTLANTVHSQMHLQQALKQLHETLSKLENAQLDTLHNDPLQGIQRAMQRVQSIKYTLDRVHARLEQVRFTR